MNTCLFNYSINQTTCAVALPGKGKLDDILWSMGGSDSTDFKNHFGCFQEYFRLTNHNRWEDLYYPNLNFGLHATPFWFPLLVREWNGYFQNIKIQAKYLRYRANITSNYGRKYVTTSPDGNITLVKAALRIVNPRYYFDPLDQYCPKLNINYLVKVFFRMASLGEEFIRESDLYNAPKSPMMRLVEWNNDWPEKGIPDYVYRSLTNNDLYLSEVLELDNVEHINLVGSVQEAQTGLMTSYTSHDESYFNDEDYDDEGRLIDWDNYEDEEEEEEYDEYYEDETAW